VFAWCGHPLYGDISMKVITKDVSSFNVDFADNGYIINYSGQDDDDNWSNTKKVVLSLEELIDEIRYAVSFSEFK